MKVFFENVNGFCDIWIWDLCFDEFIFNTTVHLHPWCVEYWGKNLLINQKAVKSRRKYEKKKNIIPVQSSILKIVLSANFDFKMILGEIHFSKSLITVFEINAIGCSNDSESLSLV